MFPLIVFYAWCIGTFGIAFKAAHYYYVKSNRSKNEAEIIFQESEIKSKLYKETIDKLVIERDEARKYAEMYREKYIAIREEYKNKITT